MASRIFQYIFVFLIALGVSWFITPLVAKMAKRLRILDKPEKNKLHKKLIPRLGGMAIFVAYFVSLLVTRNLNSHCGVIILGGAVVFLLGALDDIFKVPAVAKFTTICVLTFLLAKQGLFVGLFGDLFILNFIITLLWMVGVTSAFNAVDNMDGLAGGLGMIASITFFVIALRTSQWEWAILTIALCGALIGFLRYNFHPAKIFMGDSGSLFLGFTLAAIAIRGEWSQHPIKASIIPLLVLGVPIFDLAYIVIRRWIEGTAKGFVNAISFCAKDHLSHRLLSLGFKQRRSVLLIYLISICISIGAIVLQDAAGWDAILLFLQFILIFITVVILISITKKV